MVILSVHHDKRFQSMNANQIIHRVILLKYYHRQLFEMDRHPIEKEKQFSTTRHYYFDFKRNSFLNVPKRTRYNIAIVKNGEKNLNFVLFSYTASV